MAVRTIRELAVFRLCDELVRLLEANTASGTVAGDFRFCHQVNDAALDAAADVAEGFARFYPGEFARFLDYAIASLAEVRTRVEAGFRRGYFSVAATSDLLQLCVRADKAARGLRRYLWAIKRSDLPPRPDCSEALAIARSLRTRRRSPLPPRRRPPSCEPP